MIGVLLAAAVNGASGAAVNPSGPGLAPASLPEWLQVVIGVVAAIGGIAVLAWIANTLVELKEHFPKPEERDEKEFARMVCEQVWRHTDTLTNVFAQRLRNPPADVENLRVLIRLLREDLSAPLHFVEQMRSHTPDRWHRYPLFTAFTNWASQIAATATQLADMYQMAASPLVRDPADKRRDELIVHQFLIDRVFLDRRVDTIHGYAFDICDAAKKMLARKKRRKGFGLGDDEDGDEHDHADCPCCRRSDRHVRTPRDPFATVNVPPAPPAPAPAPKPSPAPATPTYVALCCPAPSPCHCSRGCSCGCQCGTAHAIPGVHVIPGASTTQPVALVPLAAPPSAADPPRPAS
ncbi:hypothetical protein [Sphingomonas sp.]|uniref:hypothetical protein n=1 Tax=Sphingomonas sp. TaxID=28214 RepID=UPI001B299B3F|nr:hypothetical protein [Sphingomonas sp.]MBO9712220.1 hypothetical protein [Sphingomonas sp.]